MDNPQWALFCNTMVIILLLLLNPIVAGSRYCSEHFNFVHCCWKDRTVCRAWWWIIIVPSKPQEVSWQRLSSLSRPHGQWPILQEFYQPMNVMAHCDLYIQQIYSIRGSNKICRSFFEGASPQVSLITPRVCVRGKVIGSVTCCCHHHPHTF